MAATETHMKLSDAATQMRHALRAIREDKDAEFRSCINAFISDARSITFVMQRESAEVPGLSRWYEEKRSALSGPVFKFFNDQRVYSIHKGVVRPKKERFGVRDVAETIGTNENGETERRLSVVAGREFGEVAGRGDVMHGRGDHAIVWRFDGIEEYLPGDTGNVLRLCETYFRPLKQLVLHWEVERKRLLAEQARA